MASIPSPSRGDLTEEWSCSELIPSWEVCPEGTGCVIPYEVCLERMGCVDQIYSARWIDTFLLQIEKSSKEESIFIMQHYSCKKDSREFHTIPYLPSRDVIPIMSSNSGFGESCHCEHSEAIPVFRLLRRGVYPELRRRTPRNDISLYTYLSNSIGIN